VFLNYFGPSIRASDAAGEEARERFRSDLHGVFNRYNRATDGPALPAPDVVCVPELFIAPGASLASYAAEIAWLQACHRRGALLAATPMHAH
jgi:hypothetical protein